MANGPGVIMTGSFVHPSSSAYGGYIDYMNRNEAVRNQFFDTYNAISKLNRETAVTTWRERMKLSFLLTMIT